MILEKLLVVTTLFHNKAISPTAVNTNGYATSSYDDKNIRYL